jgi:hypothetical protein
MKTLDKNSFLKLANYTGKNCISIYIPTHKVGQEVLERYDAINLKNHLQRIYSDLSKNGMKKHEVDALLKPAYDLLDESEFWRKQQEGLAIFITEGHFEYHQSPIRFDEFSLISQSFYVKPLIPLTSGLNRYYLLKLSKKEAELFECTRFTINKVKIEGLAPTNLEEIIKHYDTIEEAQGRGNISGPGEVTYHNHNQNMEKAFLLAEYFRNINGGIMKIIGHDNAPLVVAGVEYFHPIYREANTYPHLCKEGLAGSFDRTNPQEMHQLSRNIVTPLFAAPLKRRAEQFQNLTGSDRISIDVKEILKHASTGRVEALFVSKDINVWGKFDEQDLEVAVHSEFQDNDECLLNKASVKALENGGEVYVSENSRLSDIAIDVPIAAILRY